MSFLTASPYLNLAALLTIRERGRVIMCPQLDEMGLTFSTLQIKLGPDANPPGCRLRRKTTSCKD